MALFYRLVGVLLILLGLPLFWTPVPVGAVLILGGVALLVANSATARSWLHRRRARHPRLDQWMEKSEKYMPPAFARILHRTGAHDS
ncbi:hypothetical protein ACQKH5_07265 [Hyphomonas sp. NPDC076900]|uniref:hypothetical protein n=1 Tax=unclassified Hyphomonas TaxID=2630699 RepID=UPI003D009291